MLNIWKILNKKREKVETLLKHQLTLLNKYRVITVGYDP